MSVAHALVVTRIHSFSVCETSNAGTMLLTEVYLLSVVLLEGVRTWIDCNMPVDVLWNFSQCKSVDVVQILA